MLKQVIQLDENGFFIRDLILKKDGEVPANCIEVLLPRDTNGNQLPFYRPKWTGTEWIEDMSQEEINELSNQPKLPTTDDFLLDFEFRLSMLELGL